MSYYIILFASSGLTLVKNKLNLFAISALSVIRCSSCFRLIKFVLLVGDLFKIELIVFHVCCIYRFGICRIVP